MAVKKSTRAPARKSVTKSLRTVAKKSSQQTVKSASAKPGQLSAKKSAAAANQVYLAGGNPQIAKGYGDEPVQAYIDALSGWRQDVVRQIDSLITRTIPQIMKAVKWNAPMYGVSEHHYFVGMHVYTKFVKVAFFTGNSLTPMPPVPSKTKNARYLDIYETDKVDTKQFAAWLKQASKLPGEKM